MIGVVAVGHQVDRVDRRIGERLLKRVEDVGAAAERQRLDDAQVLIGGGIIVNDGVGGGAIARGPARAADSRKNAGLGASVTVKVSSGSLAVSLTSCTGMLMVSVAVPLSVQ